MVFFPESLPRRVRRTNPAFKLQKIGELLPTNGPEALYLGLASQWNDPTSFVLGASALPPLLNSTISGPLFQITFGQ